MSDETHKRTTYYRRWQIDSTIKGGWRPKDMTVSASWEEGKEPTHEQMVEQARKCRAEAQQACDELNNQNSQIERIRKQESV